MSDGATHTVANIVSLGSLSLVGLSYHLDITPFFLGGMLGTLLITPDLDLSGRVRTTAHKNWGIVAGLWYPLRFFVKHRGITHTFIRGPLFLLLYFVVLMTFLGFAAVWLTGELGLHWTTPALPTGPQLISGFGGYLLAYWIHLWMDGYSLRTLSRW